MSTITRTSSGSWVSAYDTCNSGDIISLNVSGGQNINIAYAFLDYNNVVIQRAPNSIIITEGQIIAPENSHIVIVNTRKNKDHYYAAIGRVIINDVDRHSTELETLNNELSDLNSKIHYKSSNLYDPSLQTSETISPHYYVNGVPYSSTQYDNQWNCTALIEVKPNTTYTVAIVPTIASISKPWGSASQGGFYYDSEGNWINNGVFNTNTFTTTSTTKYIRFNYYIKRITLNNLNTHCMLIEGDTIPSSYESYYDYWIKDKINYIEEEISSVTSKGNINYVIDSDGNGVTLISKYSNTHDIAIYLAKHGGNNIFDFYQIGLVPNTTKSISTSTTGISYLISSSGDWHAPFIVAAVNNIDGDHPTSEYFTGGNHQYNNTGEGSTPTGRTTTLKFYADNMEITSGTGDCRSFEITWTNLVQGYNTSKADGTGREILQETHVLVFDGNKFDDYVDLLPLEDVMMQTWYGYQWKTSPYPYVRYVGGSNREEYAVASSTSQSGDNKCCFVRGYSSSNEIRISIDETYDLGDRKFYTSGAKGIFTETYGKGYFWIIKNASLLSNKMYSLHGSYQFIQKR